MKSNMDWCPTKPGKFHFSSFLSLMLIFVHRHICWVAFLPSLNALQDPFMVPLWTFCISSPAKNKQKLAPKDAVIHTYWHYCNYQFINFILHSFTILRGHCTSNVAFFEITQPHPLQIYEMFNFLNRSHS